MKRATLGPDVRHRLAFAWSAILRAAALLMGAVLAAPLAAGDPKVDFHREVRPILSSACWTCHGFDQRARQAGLRLDTREGSLRGGESGRPAIVPERPDDSGIVARITADDPDLRMPPPDSRKSLTADQITTLRRWIEQGARFEEHWAFQPPRDVTPPPLSDGLNPVDAFVAAKFPDQSIGFTPEESRDTLLRRVTFDLTGVPPTIEDMDRVTESYEAAVDRLLASPQFGERMAVDWLDAARYADTNGYFGDKPRQMWLWRDWVIDAFNSNMPFDQFTIEQLAGDLLPNATISQRVATGFNRNHMMNNETGIIDEEFRTEYVIDRVDATMTTWLGLTVACAQCHDHKYDPITQRDYYGVFAFFNDVPEKGLITVDNPPPLLQVPTAEQARTLMDLTASRKAAEATFNELRPGLESQLQDWEANAPQTLAAPPGTDVVLHEPLDQTTKSIASGELPPLAAGVVGQAMTFDATRHVEVDVATFDPDRPWTIGFWVQGDGPLACPLSIIEPDGRRRGMEVVWQKGRLQINLVSQWGVNRIEAWSRTAIRRKEWHHVAIRSDGSRKARGLSLLIDGVPRPLEIKSDSLTGSLRGQEPLRIGRRDAGLGFYGMLDELWIVQAVLTDEEIAAWQRGERVRGILEVPRDSRSKDQQRVLLDHFIRWHADDAAHTAHQRLQEAESAEQQHRASIPTTLVMQRMEKPRPTSILNRGQYDQPGAEVEPAIPTAFPGLAPDMPPDRVGFARWLVSERSPLTARVAVNRLWRQCFGEGLVRTMNDFGVQGEPPTHPELLDWLAVRFRDCGWDVKALLRLIVTSRTYRQSSAFRIVNGAVFDSQNRFLTRGPSFRLSAEMIRDQALSASGLLSRRIGGPSVRPYQPPGLWEEVSFNAEESYVEDQGEGLWRRSLYTYQKRQAPPPALLAFDGPTREKCTVQRGRTNTPLQALIVLNDPTYVEAARALSQSLLRSPGTDDERITVAFRRILSRSPEAAERGTLIGLLQRQRSRLKDQADAPTAVVSVGRAALDSSLNQRELAAWTIVIQTLFNLDEALSRR
jgi:hypothetical protein